MDLFEYQARDLFEKHGVPVLAGAVATTADEAFAAASKMGGKVVVKAQVKVGGRGKAGGVKLAENADDAREKAAAILGMDIKGHTVHQVMIAQAAPIESEYYLAILLDRSNRTFLEESYCNLKSEIGVVAFLFLSCNQSQLFRLI